MVIKCIDDVGVEIDIFMYLKVLNRVILFCLIFSFFFKKKFILLLCIFLGRWMKLKFWREFIILVRVGLEILLVVS